LELRGEPPRALEALDLVVGGTAVAMAVVSAAGTVVGTVVGKALEPSFVPERLRPRQVIAGVLRPVVRVGGVQRRRLTFEAARQLDAVLPPVADLVMSRLPLTDLVRRHLDLDAIVADVDLDAVVMRLDLDEIAARLDVDAVLDRLDLTATVVNRVEFRTVVDAVLAEVDIAGIVSEVLDEIDLPEIIRESTGTMASETVQTVRMRGVGADEAVSRLAARLKLGRGRPAAGGATPE